MTTPNAPTRLHRAEVRHQISRLARAGGPNVPVSAIERHLGYPLIEASHGDLKGVAAALAAVTNTLTEEAR